MSGFVQDDFVQREGEQCHCPQAGVQDRARCPRAGAEHQGNDDEQPDIVGVHGIIANFPHGKSEDGAEQQGCDAIVIVVLAEDENGQGQRNQPKGDGGKQEEAALFGI